MSTFDETTKQEAEEYAQIHSVYTKELHGNIVADFTAGRESVKESLAIAVRGLTLSCCCVPAAEGQMEKCDACDALALIRERGDLP